jgi:hypothetical protein
MSTRRSGHAGRKRSRPRPLPTSSRPPTPREQWDQACARFVDAVMADDPDAAQVAYAEALVFLSTIDDLQVRR